MSSESDEQSADVNGLCSQSLRCDEKVCPDPDTIKMFIGQIPKAWDELQLKEYFEEFGPIYQLSVLRDKETASSRGCCFVTYYHRKDAISAQNELHNVRTFPGLSHPIQMKPADVENKNERKLFIGMLPKSMDEESVRALFKEFGQVEDCSILREDGKSKGCAFLTLVSRSCAQQAIRKMHHSQIFEGCSKPLVVKFADSCREKNAKKAPDAKNEEGPKPNGGKLTSNNQNSQLLTASGTETLANLVTLLQQPNVISLLEAARVIQSAQNVTSSADLLLKMDQNRQQNLFKMPTILPPNLHQGTLLGLSQGLLLQQSAVGASPLGHSALNLNVPHSVPSAIHSVLPTTPPNLPIISPSCSIVSRMTPANPSYPTDKYNRGPDGCNLFIYHLPQDFADTDLYSLFAHFGQILSAKVFIDKQTNLSKCFGFVSFSDESSAQNAISGMNGFQIGAKRLKVQLKRSDSKPYEKPIA
ncbi:hypothetical protein niasHT_021497 [Heterodera trifolii]|uniref:RRM domain-containing protein n=1 Tax=Heterodera trifolii TaxID=157864 RepID=A0ABD2KFV8_9BILA